MSSLFSGFIIDVTLEKHPLESSACNCVDLEFTVLYVLSIEAPYAIPSSSVSDDIMTGLFLTGLHGRSSRSGWQFGASWGGAESGGS